MGCPNRLLDGNLPAAIEALNQHVFERCNVPEISKETLVSFMQRSTYIPPYVPRLVTTLWGRNAHPQYYYALLHEAIGEEGLTAALFPNNILEINIGANHNLVMYFNRQYKTVMLGYPKQRVSAHRPDEYYSSGQFNQEWNHYDQPVPIYTNYDFYIEVAVKEDCFQEVLKWQEHEHSQSWMAAVQPVPLTGVNCTRDQLKVTFASLSPSKDTDSKRLEEPSFEELADFLKERKPYIHPVVVLDYLKEQPLPMVAAFFSNVAEYQLSDAQSKLAESETARTQSAAQVLALEEALQVERDRCQEQAVLLQEQEEQLETQLAQLNTAALRIRKLELKLTQSVRMYDELQTRLIEQDGFDDLRDIDGSAEEVAGDEEEVEEEETA